MLAGEHSYAMFQFVQIVRRYPFLACPFSQPNELHVAQWQSADHDAGVIS
jgi:hypothetical protein